MTQAKISLSIDGVKSVVSGLKDVGTRIGDVTTSIAGLTTIGGALSFAALVGRIRSSVDELANLDDMAQKTGSSVENLSKLQKVASAFNQEFGAVDASLSKLAKGMASVDDESNKTQQALKALGVSAVDEFGNLRDTSEVMMDVAKSLQNYKDDASKAAIVTDLFGKAGVNLLPYLNDLAENVDRFGGATGEAAKQASEFQDKLGITRVKVNDLFEKMSIALLPTMNDIIDAFADTKDGSNKLNNDPNIGGWADTLASKVATAADFLHNYVTLMRIAGQVAGEVGAKAEIKIRAGQERQEAMKGSEWKLFLDDVTKKKLADIDARERAAINAVTAAGGDDRDGIIMGAGKFTRALENRRADKALLDQNDFGVGLPGIPKNGDSRKGLGYSSPSGGGKGKGGKSDAEKLAEDSAKFIAKLQEEADTFDLSGAALTAYQAKKAGYSTQTQAIAVALSAQINQMKSAKAAAEEYDKLIDKLTGERDGLREQSAAMEEYNAKIGLSKEAIAELDAAKLDSLATDKEKTAALREELFLLDDVTALMKEQAAELRKQASLKREGARTESIVDEQKKIAEASQKVWDNFTENVQRNLGDGLYDAMQGNFKNIGNAFKSMIDRMVADALAAKLSESMFGGKGTTGGGMLGGLLDTALGFMGLGGGGGGYAGGLISAMGSGSGVKESFAAFDSANPYALAESFDGGGYTGDGARSGGLDGKGGFLAMMHPQEDVYDRTKGQAAPQAAPSNSTNVTVTNHFSISQPASRESQQQIAAAAGQAVNRAIRRNA